MRGHSTIPGQAISFGLQLTAIFFRSLCPPSTLTRSSRPSSLICERGNNTCKFLIVVCLFIVSKVTILKKNSLSLPHHIKSLAPQSQPPPMPPPTSSLPPSSPTQPRPRALTSTSELGAGILRSRARQLWVVDCCVQFNCFKNYDSNFFYSATSLTTPLRPAVTSTRTKLYATSTGTINDYKYNNQQNQL